MNKIPASLTHDEALIADALVLGSIRRDGMQLMSRDDAEQMVLSTRYMRAPCP